jgi:hypothetical protein
MTSHRFPRALTTLALLLVPFAGACFEDEDSSVGNDVDSGATNTDASTGCASDNIVCSEPNIPVGCHLGASKCVNGVYACPSVVCPADAGACSGSEVCNEPNVPEGCYLGPGSCVNGAYECPPVVCPADSGTCAAVACVEPPIPSGCQLGQPTCVNGQYVCAPVVCPGDAGSCSTDNVVCSEPNIPPGCSLGEPSCVNGQYQCPPVVCPVNADAGSFACDQATCDAATQYCFITQGGAIHPDGSVNMSGVCNPIPTACANDTAGAAATCACLQQQAHGTTCSSNGDDYTVYLDAP